MLHTVNNIHLFTRNTEVQKGVHYSGIKIYNRLTRELKQLSSDQKSFGFALKEFYIQTFLFIKGVFSLQM
jgi:hypothetical protein